MKITVTDVRLVAFSAGTLRAYLSKDAGHIAWISRYTMIVPKGRRGILFAEGDTAYLSGTVSPEPFAKVALKRCFTAMLDLDPEEGLYDERTGIAARRIGKSAAFELTMPCGETACLKASTIKRLVKELDFA